MRTTGQGVAKELVDQRGGDGLGVDPDLVFFFKSHRVIDQQLRQPRHAWIRHQQHLSETQTSLEQRAGRQPGQPVYAMRL